MLTTTRSPSSRARVTRERWPWCRAPMVGTRTIRSPAAFQARMQARMGSTVSNRTGVTGEAWLLIGALRQDFIRGVDRASTIPDPCRNARWRRWATSVAIGQQRPAERIVHAQGRFEAVIARFPEPVGRSDIARIVRRVGGDGYASRDTGDPSGSRTLPSRRAVLVRAPGSNAAAAPAPGTGRLASTP